MSKARKYLGGLLQSRSLRLSFSIVLLMLSVLFIADFLGIRGDQRSVLRDARGLVAQTLALQLSTLASLDRNSDIENAVAGFVKSNEDVLAAALVEINGTPVASYGDHLLLSQVTEESTLTHISVPILDRDQWWGQVKVVFASNSIWIGDLLWYGFFVLVSFLVGWLFFNKSLLQLDPSKAVPGRVDSAFNMFSEGVLILDSKLRIVMINTAASGVIDQPAEHLMGKTLDDWPWVRNDNWQAPWATALHSGLDIIDKQLHLGVNAEQSRLFMVSCSLVGDADDAQHGVLVTLDDQTTIEKKNQELESTLGKLRVTQDSLNAKNRKLEVLATRDPLTGLYNRRVLMENLQSAFDYAKANDTPLCCIMSDIDHFKQVNDEHGHMVGDEVIKAVAGTLQRASREEDTVGRYGGEEFVLVVPGRSASESVEVAERVRMAVESLKHRQEFPLDHVSTSFGVADLSHGASTIEELVDQADKALYAAKQHGRNLVVQYNPSITTGNVSAAAIIKQPAPATNNTENSKRLEELEELVQQRNDDIHRLRQYDDLTGAPTRDLFLQRAANEMERAIRLKSGIGVMSFEIRDLTRIVSIFGHEAGNQLVVDFVERLHNGLRSTDLISEIAADQSLSRITNNEYGVLLSDLGTSENAMPVITRLRRMLAKPFIVNDEKAYVGANIGIAVHPQCGSTAEELLESASRARLEAAPSPDKVSHVFASSQLDEVSRSYIRTEALLHDALEKGELELFYQPKFDLAQRRVTGLEALLRWSNDELGFVSPDTFIPIAEANGLISGIFDFVLTSALSKLQELEQLGHDGLRVSINLSPVQLRDRRLVKKILTAVREYKIDVSQLEVELTETAVIDNRESAFEYLHELRAAGIKISMDDFGTGYTSLALLADLPLDTVKIDRTFIDAIQSSEKSRAIVESVINMAHALKLTVIGEGIETNEQLSTLTQLGCNEIQGYLISEPLPAQRLPEFLMRHAHTLSRRSA